MRALTVALFFAITLNAFGQGIPQLPYNPDENGDGLIGVPDLQALLAQYGLEFNSAVLSEDAQSAIVYMGEMAHPLCTQACDNLPGFWHMSTMADLGLVWDELSNTSNTWVNSTEVFYDAPFYVAAYHFLEGSTGIHSITVYPYSIFRCYCAAHELPKVEYSYCEGSDIQACAEDKVTNGWFPLNGVSSHHRYPGTNNNYVADIDYQWKVQAFWRWAE